MVFGIPGLRKRGDDEPVVTESTGSPPAADYQPYGDSKTGGGPDVAESSGIDVDNAREQLAKFKKTHQWDYNLDYEDIAAVNRAVESDDSEKAVNLEHHLLEEDSPYFEVRAAVRNYDEDVPVNTFRTWFIGLIATTIVSGVNMLFSLRNPQIYLYVYIVQLLAYPVGVGMAQALPTRQWNLFGWRFSLNPGPFNIKEHALIVIMANVCLQGGTAYATDVLLAQQIFYKQNLGWGYQILLAITTQCLGFGLAGMVRRFLVWPAAMIWPGVLANTSMLYALHDHTPTDPADANGWSIGRYRYFLYVMTGSFVWYWFPGWIWQGLSYFNWIPWIAPNNLIINQIFGNSSGFGLIPITFDWTIVTGFIGSPLPYPFFTIVNIIIGVLLFFVILCVPLKYTHKLYQDYLPIASTKSFDNTGHKYNVTRIMTPSLEFDPVAYHSYSPLYLGMFFTICYGVSFGTLSAVIVHTGLYHHKEIWERWKLARNQDADVHLKMMRKYPDTPEWWYLTLFVILFALSLVTVLYWETHLTWWALIISILLAIIFLIPIGMVQATTNQQIGLNVLTEFIVGYMLPGRPVAMMLFKTYGYITMSQALYFLMDLKLGHYIKIPPRTTFVAQGIACAWSALVQIAVMNWALGNIEGVCTDDQPDRYTCPNASVFFTASIIWGAIGPARVFGAGSLYANLHWFWLAGAVLPVITYYAAKRWPSSPIRYLHWPVIFGGNGLIPPATVYIYLCWGVVGMFFNGFIKRRFRGWWANYNYLTSAGLDTGLYLSTLVIFFALILPQKVNPPQWWMNPRADENTTVGNAFNNMDWLGSAIQSTVAPGETFGPSTWK